MSCVAIDLIVCEIVFSSFGGRRLWHASAPIQDLSMIMPRLSCERKLTGTREKVGFIFLSEEHLITNYNRKLY